MLLPLLLALLLVRTAHAAHQGTAAATDAFIAWLESESPSRTGPSGVGVLYGKEALLDAMPPFLGGGSMIRRVRTDGFEPGMLPQRFEAGTPPIAQAIGLTAAIEYHPLIDVTRRRQDDLDVPLPAIIGQQAVGDVNHCLQRDGQGQGLRAANPGGRVQMAGQQERARLPTFPQPGNGPSSACSISTREA